MKRGDRKVAPFHFRPCAHVCRKRESVRAFLSDGSDASPVRRRSWGSAAPAQTRRRRGRRCIRRSRSTHRRWLQVGRSCSSRNWGAVRAWRWTRLRMRQQSAVTSLASAMRPIRLQTSGRAARPRKHYAGMLHGARSKPWLRSSSRERCSASSSCCGSL